MADASFFINNDPNNNTAIFKFQRMLAKHWGDNIVRTSANGLPSVRVNGASTSLDMPRLSFSAATSGNKVFVIVANPSLTGYTFKRASVTIFEISR
ncbi:hypothetical protein D3C72_939070 [compost metagenome]